jgi:hypothetical protein
VNASLFAMTLAASPVHVEVEAATAAAAEDLEAWLELRLVEEGWATTEDPRAAAIRLRLVVREREVWIEADGETLGRDRVDVLGDEVGRLEVLHRAIETLERAQAIEDDAAAVASAVAKEQGTAATPAASAKPAASPTAATRAPASAPTRSDRRARERAGEPRFSGPFAGPFAARIGARAGIVARSSTNTPVVDPQVGAALRLGRAPGLGLRLDVQVWPAVTGPVRVVEVVPAAGPSLRIRASERLDIDVSFLVGALVHAWRLGSERDARTDASFELPIDLDIRLPRGFAIAISPSVGVATRQRRHVIEDDVAWARGAWRVAVAVGLAWHKERAR